MNSEINNNSKEEENMKNNQNSKDEGCNVKITGEVTDIIRYKDGRVEERKGHNLVVNDITRLIAALLKMQSGITGIQYWAIGSGLSSWDSTTPPSPVATATDLITEIGRKVVPADAISFLDNSDVVTASVTNKIQVKLTFGYSDCNGSWREFGIFGGDATATANSGYMVNHKTHGLIVKTDQMEIERTIKFTFN